MKFQDIITKNDDIKCCKRELQNHEIVWNDLHQRNNKFHLLCPLEYFYKYINDAEFKK